MKNLRTLLFCGLSMFASLASGEVRDSNEVVMVREEDPEMLAAIRAARQGLDQFFMLAAKPPAGTSRFKLKVMVRDGRRSEHFWVMPFERNGQRFSGVLANEPRVVGNVTLGETIHFTRADITDWGYSKGDRQVGSATVCVLLKKMPAEQAAYYRKNHGFDC